MELKKLIIVIFIFPQVQSTISKNYPVHVLDSINSLATKLSQLQTPLVKSARYPQSLSILMNFGHDGTSSLHLMADFNSIYWSDSGNCIHGQMYDPYIGFCRDIFCVEGYTFGQSGCVLDPEFNRTMAQQPNTPISKINPSFHIQLTVFNKLCVVIEGFNDTLNCSNQLLANETKFLKEFQLKLAELLDINSKRLENFVVIRHEIIKKDFEERDIDANKDYENSTEIKKYRLVESNMLTFVIKHRLFSGQNTTEQESLQLYFNLIGFGLEQQVFNVLKRKVTISNIIEIKTSDYTSWCGAPFDNKSHVQNDYRILVSFEPTKRYFVYVKPTDMYYGTGYFYLTILYKPINEQSAKSNVISSDDFNEHTYEGLHEDNKMEEPWRIDYRKLKFTDITEYILKTNDTSMEISSFLTVCDRGPKIRVQCDNFTTIRVRICEFEYISSNRSFCWLKLNNKCYSIDEYEYDFKQPDKFIRICQFLPNSKLDYKQIASEPNVLFVLIPSYLSLIANCISLSLMILTLITYALFEELRNIPGWNIINLTMAITIAQSAFLIGSYVNQLPYLCFMVALITHYGYLASFFWMNVIAFDLYRNFRDKSSHILIQSLKLRDRLPIYALYGWVSPSVIVIIGLVVDLSISKPIGEVPFRPCYASYLQGCDFNNILISQIKFKINDSFERNNSSNRCDDPKINNILMKACWIQNGRANLVLFGLPIGLIIIINAVYFFVTVYNIRKKKSKQRESKLRRFSRVKLPVDEDIKFYIQMAVIMGFTWISGFMMTGVNDNDHVFNNVLLYMFIAANGFTGGFIFFAFICRAEVKTLYLKMIKRKRKGGLSVAKRSISLNNNQLSKVNSSSQRTLSSSLSSSIILTNGIEQGVNLVKYSRELGNSVGSSIGDSVTSDEVFYIQNGIN